MTERTILHVDMDAFFAAIEQHDRPEWRGRPVIVGAAPTARGVVATCSYEARVYGVRSAMPSRTAYRLCPHAIFTPVRGSRYAAVSGEIFAIMGRFSPRLEPVSVDEAFLDITGSRHLFGGDEATARQLKAAIHAETGLTASVGLAANKFLAKVASDLHKPDGLTLVPRDPEQVRAFLAPLPVRRLWGVGEKTAAQLAQAGLRLIGELQRLTRAELEAILGATWGAHVCELAAGHDDRPVIGDTPEKSIAHEYTFPADLCDWPRLEQRLVALAEQVGHRLRARGLVARTVQLKLRWAPFRTITRQQTLAPPVDSDRDLIRAALALLAHERARQPVRLIGFGVTGLRPGDERYRAVQPDLFAAADRPRDPRRDRRLDAAVDRIRDRYGSASLRRGDWADDPDG